MTPPLQCDTISFLGLKIEHMAYRISDAGSRSEVSATVHVTEDGFQVSAEDTALCHPWHNNSTRRLLRTGLH